MTPRRAHRSRRPPLVAAVAVLVAACHHENPVAPLPVRDAIDVHPASLVTSEGGPPATFEVVLRSRPSAPVEVEVRSGDPGEGLVLAPGHAVPAAAHTITFNPDDWDVRRRIAVHPVEDHVVDGTARYAVSLRVAYTTDAAYGAAPQGEVAVANADSDAPAIEVSAHALETWENGPPATLDVRVTTIPTSWLYLSVSSDDPGEGGVLLADASCASAQASQWLSFDSFHLSHRVTVCPVDDLQADGPRSWSLTVAWANGTAPEYESVAPEVVTVTNRDDDTAAVVIENAASPLLTSENGGQATFTVRLATPPLADVVVPVTSGNPAEGRVARQGEVPAASASLTFTAGDWWSPQVVVVEGVDDLASPAAGDDATYEVAVGPPDTLDPAYSALAAQALPALNLDNDTPRLLLDPPGPLVTWESGSTASFTVALLRRPPAADTVVSVTSGDPAEGLVFEPYGAPTTSVDLLFTAADWETPRTVAVAGRPDQALDGDRTYDVVVAAVSGDPAYLALGPAAIPITNRDEVASSVPLAVHDPALHAPTCATPSYGCGSGTLLDGRGPLGPEPNQPNATCGDGTSGGYHSSESLDALKVWTPDGTTIAPGKTIVVEAKVWVSWYSQDRLDLYHASDATAPAWTFVGTYAPPWYGYGAQVIRTAYTVPSGVALHAIRARWRNGGTALPAGTCTSPSGAPLDDWDDLVFAVSTVPP